ncbi:nitroreductase family protein [Sinomicrobium sp. M5D2P9]
MRAKIKKILGEKLYIELTTPLAYIRDLKSLHTNFYVDKKLYKKHSNVFKVDNFEKKEANIILYYHSIEKGFLFKNPKHRFAKEKIIRLHKYLKDKEVIKNINLSQIRTGYSVVCRYYEFHKEKDIEIESYFSEKDYLFYKGILSNYYSQNFNGIKKFTFDEFYSDIDSNFLDFSNSRRSVRDFTGELIDEQQIKAAVTLALNSPSVCNRQSAKVHLLQDKVKIDEILKIQAGFRGYSENVKQLLVLTADRNYFYTVGERNQLYIDGGIFLMNLLYALHFYKIANCPANWGKTVKDDRLARKVIDLKENEKIICLIPIGKAVDDIRVCLSERRTIDEVLKII